MAGATNTTNLQAGFTLIELIVTVVIIGIAVAGIAGVYYTLEVSQTKSQHLDLATRAARTEIEQLRNTGYNNLTAGSTIDFTASLPSQLPPGKSGSAAVSAPSDGLRRIDATITYSDFGQVQTVTLSSDIGVIGIGKGQ